MTDDGQVTLDDEGLFRPQVNERAVFLWVPGGAKKLQVRLMVCAHMKEAGRRGGVATLQRLSEYCCWFHMEEHVTEFVSVSIAWIPQRLKSSTSNICVLEKMGCWVTMAWMRQGGTWSVFVRSVVVARMRFGVGYAGVNHSRV